MALSASYNFILTADQIIEAALRKMSRLAEGQSATTNQKSTATQALNVMLKAWQAKGMPIWYMKTAYVYPVDGVNSVSIGTGGGHASEELILTKLTTAASSGATSIVVDTTAAVDVVGTTADSDPIGVEMDDGTIHWTTIASGGGTGTLVLTAGIDDDAAVGNRVYAYTAKMVRPEAISDLWAVTASDGSKVEVTLDSFSEVRGQSVLSTEGVPIVANYQETLTTGTLLFWPRFQNGDVYLEMRYQSPFDDIDTSSTDNIALPDAWYEAVIYGLAKRLAPEYDLPLDKRQVLSMEAQSAYQLADEATTEGGSVYVQPDTQGN